MFCGQFYFIFYVSRFSFYISIKCFVVGFVRLVGDDDFKVFASNDINSIFLFYDFFIITNNVFLMVSDCISIIFRFVVLSTNLNLLNFEIHKLINISYLIYVNNL